MSDKNSPLSVLEARKRRQERAPLILGIASVLLILGAAAGMGFASLESNGYAFVAFLQSHGSLSITVFVTLLRGLLSPLGHGTWTAILTGVLFRESAPNRFHITRRVIGAYQEGKGSTVLPADLGVARSLIPAGTGYSTGWE